MINVTELLKRGFDPLKLSVVLKNAKRPLIDHHTWPEATAINEILNAAIKELEPYVNIKYSKNKEEK